ncbi:MAG: tRNA 2-thiouridine(34) synthase MnmA [Candidatus Pacebacteria bacterium]|nr:tRNA 2-thiouridine(34) synthase MnmA [Candidatus Paceibacterota bacterium]
MTNKGHNKTVFVGVSGGVDSSVSAALLQDQGYHVVGVFMRTWQPDWIECTWQDERRDAMRVCAHLNIPFVELDLEKEYKEGVADYMIREYRAGRTPNPDVMCNREVKFGGFLKWALEKGADYVATGHYVDRAVDDSGVVTMLRGNDPQKDQTYFLWTLEQSQLKHILFPVGSMPKKEVRKLAKKYNLPTAVKKDSQGICFIGDIDMKDFLNHYIDETPGDVINKSGDVIGSHKGSLFYTISERHGFTIHASHKGVNDSPYYVVAKDIEKNTITVSQNPEKDTRLTDTFSLVDVVDNKNILQKGDIIEAQIRYRGSVKNITFLEIDHDTKTAKIQFDDIDATIAPGQSVVFYKGSECLGGGILA